MTKATESSGAQRKGNANLKPFKKGQSGNPGGIPKDLREVIALARSHTVTAITALAEIAGSPVAPESGGFEKPPGFEACSVIPFVWFWLREWRYEAGWFL